MITTNVYYRTFYIAYGDGTGTAFAIDVEGRQYLVTAAHVVSGIASGDQVAFWNDGSWQPETIQLVGIGSKNAIEADVAVLALKEQIAPSFELIPSSGNIVWGQEVYFLGFPFGLFGAPQLMHNGYPFPLIKRAILSGRTDDPNSCYLLDGHNNPGFSGGPMVFKPMGSQDFKVGGIISGYRSVSAEITLNGKPTGLAAQLTPG